MAYTVFCIKISTIWPDARTLVSPKALKEFESNEDWLRSIKNAEINGKFDSASGHIEAFIQDRHMDYCERSDHATLNCMNENELYKSLIESVHAHLLDPEPENSYEGMIGDFEAISFEIEGMRSVKLKGSAQSELTTYQKESAAFERQFLEDRAAEVASNSGNSLTEGAVTQESDNFNNPSCYGFVYMIKNKDLYKIGITENLLRRMDQLKPDEVLNVVRCKNYRELERDLHSLFKEVRLPQTEYFRLSQEQINKVHKLMTSLADF